MHSSIKVSTDVRISFSGGAWGADSNKRDNERVTSVDIAEVNTNVADKIRFNPDGNLALLSKTWQARTIVRNVGISGRFFCQISNILSAIGQKY